MSLAVKLSVLLFKLMQEYIGTSSAVALFSVTIAKNHGLQMMKCNCLRNLLHGIIDRFCF